MNAQNINYSNCKFCNKKVKAINLNYHIESEHKKKKKKTYNKFEKFIYEEAILTIIFLLIYTFMITINLQLDFYERLGILIGILVVYFYKRNKYYKCQLNLNTSNSNK